MILRCVAVSSVVPGLAACIDGVERTRAGRVRLVVIENPGARAPGPTIMISITPSIAIDERDISESFIRASGPGGQHVNKTSSAVELRFDALGSPHLPEHLKHRLTAIAGHRMTRDGIVILTSDVHRSQARNREDALAKLVDLLREASVRRAIRRPTRPTLASKTRRLDGKARRGDIKSGRRSARPDGD